MREIKFRYVFKRKEDGHIYMLILSIKRFEEVYEELDSVIDNPLWELVSRDQFTGLHDKNGVEIYEGDILSGWGKQSLVTWIDHTQHPGFDIGNLPNADLCKVIGNIHENSDLLSEEE